MVRQILSFRDPTRRQYQIIFDNGVTCETSLICTRKFSIVSVQKHFQRFERSLFSPLGESTVLGGSLSPSLEVFRKSVMAATFFNIVLLTNSNTAVNCYVFGNGQLCWAVSKLRRD